MTSVSRYMEGSIRGGQWLAGQLNPQGLLPVDLGLHACHKGIWALAASGQIEAAHQLADGIRDHMMSQPGEFYPEGEGKEDAFRSYYAAIALVGAARLGRFDLASSGAADRLCAYQQPSGAFSGTINPPLATVNLCVTAMCGWACLALGREDAALRAGNFLAAAFESQPDTTKYLYCHADSQTGQLFTEIPTNTRIQHVLDTQGAEQCFFYTGIAAGFLADLSTLARSTRYLEAACGYIDFDLRTNPEGFHWPSKCKVGWGAALLYRVTGEARHRELAERVANVTLLGAQHPEGDWDGMDFPVTDDGGTVPVTRHEITAEFTYELSELAGALTAKSQQPAEPAA